jgi:hypothetical protein
VARPVGDRRPILGDIVLGAIEQVREHIDAVAGTRIKSCRQL